MRALLSLALVPLLAFAAGCERSPAEPAANVERVVVTLPAVPGRPGAAYFTARTNNDPTRLESLSSPAASRIELHGVSRDNGVARMAPLEPGALAFAPDAPLIFRSGGNHAMLYDLDPALRPGDRIALTFHFDPVPPVTVEAEVRGPGEGHAAH